MSDQQKYIEYSEMVKRATPGSNYLQGYLRAFWVGGAICVLGQLLTLMYEKWCGLDDMTAGTLSSVTLIFLASTLTGIGVYDVLGKYAGAGSVVPITGFANSVAAPAIEFRREGLVLGLGAKIFALAGPVLLYGIVASVVVGLIYALIGG